MLNPEFNTLWQAWCEVEYTPYAEVATEYIKIPAYANPSTLKLQGSIVWMELGKCPESHAVMQGVMFRDGGSFTGFFECELTGTTGTLKTSSKSGGYSIDENDLTTCLFSAYYLPSADSKEAVTIEIVNEITSHCQIKIAAGGKIVVSQDLVGRTVKVAAIYPKTIVLTDEKIKSLFLHLVGESSEGKTIYAGYSGCKIEPVAGLLKVTLGDLHNSYEILDNQAC